MDLESLEYKLNLIAERIGDLTDDPNKIILSNKEFQDKLGIGRKTAQKWRDGGLITYAKIGKQIFYKYSDILDMIERHKVHSLTHKQRYKNL